ncbi:hypothetical protein GCM10020366_11060 [Saccharopolyspora gregorii]|uniref:L-asparaginase N-terminal domain-containing protein n=1 Tax=Saccharopolyspora gregorii TaxID=33914 RepID=A0ABP6RNI3_9PSEU
MVLHGTDTLAHSAAAASYALAGFGKPVVFTGAQVPFGMPGSDAPDNVRGAVEAVADAAIGRAVFSTASSSRAPARRRAPRWTGTASPARTRRPRPNARRPTSASRSPPTGATTSPWSPRCPA